MKNWKVSVKLFVSFAVIILFTCLVGGLGYLGMARMNGAERRLYNNDVIALEEIGHINSNFHQQRVVLRNYLLLTIGSREFTANEELLKTLETDMDAHIQNYELTITDEEDRDAFDAFLEKYHGEFAVFKKNVSEIGVSDASSSATSSLIKSALATDEITSEIENCYDLNVKDAEQSIRDNEGLFYTYAILQGVMILLCLGVSIAAGIALQRTIANPLAKMLDAATQIAIGDMDVTLDTESADEVGQLAEAFRRMAASLRHQALNLQQIAEGDLTADISSSGERDMIGNSLRIMSDNLNRLFHEILSASSQVSVGASHLSDGSQSLAQGASEQATAIEQLSSSIFEISLNTKENAKMAEKAAELYAGIKRRAQESTNLMKEMLRAVDEINQASLNISKIIKLINDISFQTNILSLNAAVEAANAGQHGKGFAVVAGEVRNLAAKSSQAAADTDALIENSIAKARLGADIAKKTHDALDEIVADILHSAQLIDDIAKASGEQALGVEQINLGIDQVAQVVSMNSSTAEQSAMAAEEMAAQATAMEKLVSSFRLKGGPGVSEAASLPEIPGHHKPPKKPVIILRDNPEKY